MSAKSLRKSQPLTLDAAVYGALIDYARRRGTRSLSAAARLAIRAHLAGEPPPPPRPNVAARRVRRLRLQLEPELRSALTARGLSAEEALQAFLA